jgi:hypothetical protein
MTTPDTNPPHRTRTEPLKLLAFWLIVGVPLSWGVWQVAGKSLVLFGIG